MTFRAGRARFLDVIVLSALPRSPPASADMARRTAAEEKRKQRRSLPAAVWLALYNVIASEAVATR